MPNPDGRHVGSVGALSRRSNPNPTPHRHFRPGAAQQTIASIRIVANCRRSRRDASQISIGQPFVYPKNELAYAPRTPRIAIGCRARIKVIRLLARAMRPASSSGTPTHDRTPRLHVRLSAPPAQSFACIGRLASPACLGPPPCVRQRSRLQCLLEIGRSAAPRNSARQLTMNGSPPP